MRLLKFDNAQILTLSMKFSHTSKRHEENAYRKYFLVWNSIQMRYGPKRRLRWIWSTYRWLIQFPLEVKLNPAPPAPATLLHNSLPHSHGLLPHNPVSSAWVFVLHTGVWSSLSLSFWKLYYHPNVNKWRIEPRGHLFSSMTMQLSRAHRCYPLLRTPGGLVML